MATVNYYQYEHLEKGGFQPGTEVTWWFGPWPWIKKGVAVTAQPFDLSTADRALAVTEIRVRTVPAQPTGDEYVYATIRNVGHDPIVIYYISLIEIAP
jgi:hypothetical protein